MTPGSLSSLRISVASVSHGGSAGLAGAMRRPTPTSQRVGFELVDPASTQRAAVTEVVPVDFHGTVVDDADVALSARRSRDE